MNPLAIILYGSLGRGEGSLLWMGDNLVFLSDIEIGVVPRHALDGTRTRRLAKLTSIPNVELTISNFSARRFHRWSSSNWDFQNRQVISLEQYDLLNGMKILFGDDLLNRGLLPSSRFIQKWDALRLVFNRVAELLIALSESVSPLEVSKAVNKLLLACGDSILILNGSYCTRCSEKINQIMQISDLVERNHIDMELILAAYRWKLKPIACEVERDAIVRVLQNVLYPTLRFSARSYYGWDFVSLAEFRANYLSSTSLKGCSRLYPDNSCLQTLYLSAKYLMAKRQIRYISWRKPHEIYADCVERLFDLARDESFRNGGPVNATGLSELLDSWRHICYFI
jgi:hypothetical protein